MRNEDSESAITKIRREDPARTSAGVFAREGEVVLPVTAR
jgi:hypothetical protein